MIARHQEVIDRIEYMYKDIDNNINFPDSFDGDVLKIAYESAKASLIQMNNNQKIVLEWLKDTMEQDSTSPMCAIFRLGSSWELRKFNDQESITVDNAYCELDCKQQSEVLAVFAQWGLEQEETE